MRYTRLERVVAEACKHHTVIGNRRDTQGPIGGRDSYLQVITAQTEYLDNVRNQVEIRRRRMDCIVTADAPRTQPRVKRSARREVNIRQLLAARQIAAE